MRPCRIAVGSARKPSWRLGYFTSSYIKSCGNASKDIGVGSFSLRRSIPKITQMFRLTIEADMRHNIHTPGLQKDQDLLNNTNERQSAGLLDNMSRL